jgi:hypothetical protein
MIYFLGQQDEPLVVSQVFDLEVSQQAAFPEAFDCFPDALSDCPMSFTPIMPTAARRMIAKIDFEKRFFFLGLQLPSAHPQSCFLVSSIRECF